MKTKKETAPEPEIKEPEIIKEEPIKEPGNNINIEEIKNLLETKPPIELLPLTENQNIIEPEKKKRGRPKKDETEIKEIPEEKQIEIFFNESLGALFLDLYISKLLKVENDPATKDEIKSFTDSVKSILNKYLPDSVKENAELLTFVLVMAGVTVKRIK